MGDNFRIRRVERPTRHPYLIPQLLFTENEVCKRAALALESITGQHFGDDAARWRAWWKKHNK